MKTIQLKQIELENFKKVKTLKIDFSKTTNIHGKNGSGKTTIFDAYNWLMFNKNSQNQSVFEIKTIDSKGNVLHNLEHSVKAVFLVDEEEIEIQKTYKENWVKKRGSETSELSGHTTKYFVNEVPKTLSEFKTIVDGMVSENSQKILSNPLYFNTVMSWQERRGILTQLAGDISEKDVISSMNAKTVAIINELLSSNKTLEDWKKEFASKRKKIKDELETLPTRIDEAYKSIPESKDWVSIENEIKEHEDLILEIDKKIESKSKLLDDKQNEILNIKKSKFDKEQKLSDLKQLSIKKSKESLNGLQDEISKIEDDYRNARKEVLESNGKLTDFDMDIKGLETILNQLSENRLKLIEKFENESANEYKEIDNSELSCPTCKRDFEVGKIEEIKENAKSKFETEKTESLNKIQAEGKEIKAKIESYKVDLETLKIKLKAENEYNEKVTKKLNDIHLKGKELREQLAISENNLVVEPSPEEIALQKEIESIIIPELEISLDNSDLKETKSLTSKKIDEFKSQLHDKTIIDKQKERISELESKQQMLAQEIASFEHKEIAIEDFNKAKIDTIENKVNSKFQFVKFRMFENQLNGGVNEICECTVDGVKINDVNNAMKINAGIDVINVLQQFFDVSVPIIIDNRESVTNIIDTESQLINLVVDDSCNELKVL